ncbi:MAG TPA: 50S ribosomal protein L29 [Candidatus Omnitrophota bacterium]|nr:50S ribosomal protein L29 [Candidatus Omnitrophota bacterium]HPS36182.1 50S ribosomal protein L29 [Candidatus Omnitrophota bacterium]
MAEVKELRELTVEELQEKLNTTKKDLMQLRFQHKTGKLERQSSIKEAKKNIARILTLINGMKKGEKKS